MTLDDLHGWVKVARITGTEVQVHCPFHDDRNPSMSVNTETWLYFCFGCGAKGCLVESDDSEPTTFSEINRVLADIDSLTNTETETDPDIDVPQDFRTLKGNSLYLNYMIERGISYPVIRRFGLGYCTEGTYADRIIFPIGHHGFTARTIHGERLAGLLGHKSKYIHPAGFPISRYIYANREGKIKILVEGVFDVLKLQEFGVKAGAIFGCTLHEGQLNSLLKTRANEIVIAFDGDDAGREGVKQTCFRLSNYFPEVSYIEMPNGRDPSDLKKREWKSLFNRRKLYVRGRGFFMGGLNEGIF